MINPKQRAYPRSSTDELSSGGSHALILDFVGTGKRVLEFGCSSGYMSRHLAKRNCVVTGIEFDPLAAAEARAHCDEVIVADLDSRPLVDLLPGAPFDVAVFGDVLEHLRDPWRVLDETRAFLGPGSFTVISLPNVAHGAVRLSLLQGSFNYAEQGLLDATHLRFFTLRSVRELCLRAGYRIDEIQRTKLDIFQKSDLFPEVNEADFDPELVAEIRRDPESDTLQFVVKATPLQEREKFAVAVSLVIENEKKLERALENASKKDREIESLRDKIRELEQDGKSYQANEAIALERLASAEALHRAEFTESLQARDALRSEIDGLTRALEIQAAERIAADAAALQQRSDLESDLRAELSKREAELAVANEERAAALSLAREKAGAAREAEERAALLAVDHAQLQAKSSDLQENLSAVDSELSGLRALLAQVEADRTELQARALERDAAVRNLTTQLERARREMAASDNRWRAASAERDALIERALERTCLEIELVRVELALTDELIRGIYRSKWWSLKGLFARFRFRRLESRSEN